MGPATAPEEKSGQNLNSLTDFQTRFLLPFFFERRGVAKALSALQSQTFSTREGKPMPLWECPDAHHLYKDELLPQVVQFLFGSEKGSGCGFLRIADVPANAWFAQTELALPDGNRLPVRLVPGVRIEMFLSPQGVGVVSISLTPGQSGLSQKNAVQFNYELAQFQRREGCRIRKRHPRDEPQVWEKLPPERQAQITSPPDDDAALDKRLGAPGASFTMSELVSFLLKDLKPHGISPVQRELSVYSVARFGPHVDMGAPALRGRLAPFLSALAQV
ncbi:MAG TPA: hypothetical protein VKE98_18650, partial [Gemmataceae bacterium]|nr:hypothetical protein [Gemmataceae bacterium]